MNAENIQRSRFRRRVLTLLAAPLALVACVVSPQPSPPDPDLSGDGIELLDPGTEELDGFLAFEAAPGSVTPAGGVVIVTNLDGTDAPSTVPVRDDGSFAVALPGFPNNVVRFQVDNDGARSEPIDLAVDATGQNASIVDDEPACLRIDPSRFLPLDGAGDTQTIVLTNDCADTIQIDAPRLRRGRAPISFSPTQPFDIAPGENGFVTVRALGEAEVPGANETEDVLFFEIVGPTPARRAVTVTLPD
ncbi:MAG: hypothetical protein HOW73_35240 [Polyangiaceae bacterium]|nr:hypothetical protein [Polyangiaceae bacterium]